MKIEIVVFLAKILLSTINIGETNDRGLYNDLKLFDL